MRPPPFTDIRQLTRCRAICQSTLESVTPEKELQDLSQAEEIASQKQDEQDRVLSKSSQELKGTSHVSPFCVALYTL